MYGFSLRFQTLKNQGLNFSAPFQCKGVAISKDNGPIVFVVAENSRPLGRDCLSWYF